MNKILQEKNNQLKSCLYYPYDVENEFEEDNYFVNNYQSLFNLSSKFENSENEIKQNRIVDFSESLLMYKSISFTDSEQNYEFIFNLCKRSNLFSNEHKQNQNSCANNTSVCLINKSNRNNQTSYSIGSFDLKSNFYYIRIKNKNQNFSLK